LLLDVMSEQLVDVSDKVKHLPGFSKPTFTHDVFKRNIGLGHFDSILEILFDFEIVGVEHFLKRSSMHEGQSEVSDEVVDDVLFLLTILSLGVLLEQIGVLLCIAVEVPVGRHHLQFVLEWLLQWQSVGLELHEEPEVKPWLDSNDLSNAVRCTGQRHCSSENALENLLCIQRFISVRNHVVDVEDQVVH
jgi:hypothetical protein